MPDVRRTLSALQALLADNTTGNITAQYLRDFLVSAYPVILNEPQGRLTTESGVAVSSTDRISQTDIFYTPHTGNGLWLYDGTLWQPCQFSEFGIRLAGLTSGKNYDIFAFCSSAVPSSTNTGTDVLTFLSATGWQTGAFVQVSDTGGGLTAGTNYFYRAVTATTGTLHTTVAGALAGTGTVDITGSITATLRAISLELSAAWNADTPGSTQNRFASGPYSVVLPMQDGLRVKSTNGTAIDATRLYLGTIRTTATTTTETSAGGVTSRVGGKRFLWNMYNRVLQQATVFDSAVTWAYTGATIRQANGQAGNQTECVVGVNDMSIVASVYGGAVTYSGATRGARTGVGVDSTTAMSGAVAQMFNASSVSAIICPISGLYQGFPGIGAHYFAWLESGQDGNCSFYGTDGAHQSRLILQVWG